MKQLKLTFLLTVLMSMVGAKALAHDIAVENADGKTIYYEWNSDKTELSVSYRGSAYNSYSDEYSGNIVIPESVTYRGKTYSVTSIGNSAFYECTGLTSITIPHSVTSIGRYSFYGSGWYNAQPNGLLYLDNWLLGYKGYKPTGTISIESGTRGLADYAFYGCTGLTSISIPNSVTSIGYAAFYGCTGLKKVVVEDLAAWCGISFSYYSSPLYYAHHLYDKNDNEITDLVIPNSVTSINKYAFEGCTGLTSINIPNSVTSIGGAAFYECTGLTSINIPNSVTSIGGSAFYRCTGLTSVTIPNSVTSIGGSAFSGCTGLTSITIPNSVTSIGEYAFRGCTGLTSITIPNSVTSIGDRTFNDCTGLTSITIPNSVTSIGEYNQEIKSETNMEITPVSA